MRLNLLTALILVSTFGTQPAIGAEDGFDVFRLEDSATVLPNQLSHLKNGKSTVSSQILSRQNVNGNVSFVWNLVFQYAFVLPDEEALAKIDAKKKSLPNTVEFVTYISYRKGEATTTILADSGTTNISGILTTTTDIEFADKEELAAFVAAGPKLNVTAVIRFPQVATTLSDADEVKSLILEYLSTNIVNPKAPVLSAYKEITARNPQVAGRNPALLLGALASVFENSKIEMDEEGQPKLVLPPAVDITINSSFSRPVNLRFTDQTFAHMGIDLCDDGEVTLLEIAKTGCEALEELYERFEQ